MIIPVGVTTKKKIIPMIIGDINEPKKIPNLNHILLKGVSNLELKIPSNKNIVAIMNDQILISLLFIIGHSEIIKKTIKKTIPKLRFELILISSI